MIAIYKTKVSLVKAGIQAGFSDALTIASGSIRVESSLEDIANLWSCAARLGMVSTIASDLAAKVSDMILDRIVLCRSIQPVGLTDSEWSFMPGPSTRTDLKSIVDAVGSLFEFLAKVIPSEIYVSEFVRRCWIPFTRELVRAYSVSAELAQLEASLALRGLLPTDIPMRLASGWEESQKTQQHSLLNSTLAELRSRLLADVNRKTVNININKGQEFKSAVIPRTVSAEAVNIARSYLPDPHFHATVPAIVSLFTTLRQSEFVDPKGLNARNAAIFFNDCIYLTIALSLTSEKAFTSDILLLRSAASRSMSCFIKAVAGRAVAHLAESASGSWDLGLGNQQQASAADGAVKSSIAEISACIKEWQALEIDESVQALWTAMLVERVTREINRLAVIAAKAAVAASRSAAKGILMSSSSSGLVNSAVWSVYRKFAQAVEALLTAQRLAVLNAWRVALRVRVALCGNQPDIVSMQPLTSDEDLYGISNEGFHTLLACNPLLQGESRDSLSHLADKLMMSGMEDGGNSPKRGIGEERNFAALFSRG